MADDQQQFCLRWNDFQSNMVNSFKHLRDEKSFTDVTLGMTDFLLKHWLLHLTVSIEPAACEGQTCKAHKMVLSACSPYFKSLLEVKCRDVGSFGWYWTQNWLFADRKIHPSIPSSFWKMSRLLIYKPSLNSCMLEKWMWLRISFRHSLKRPNDSKSKDWPRFHLWSKRRDRVGPTVSSKQIKKQKLSEWFSPFLFLLPNPTCYCYNKKHFFWRWLPRFIITWTLYYSLPTP